jgi:hypothetical protein
MIQTIVLILILLAGVAFAQANLGVLHSQLAVALPGVTGVPLTLLRALVAIGGALVLLWIAGLIDLQILRAQIRRKDEVVRSMEERIAQLKSEAYDRQQSVLVNIEHRLEVLARDVRNMIPRRDGTVVVESQRTARQDLPPDSVRTVREQVTTATARSDAVDEDVSRMSGWGEVPPREAAVVRDEVVVQKSRR